MRSPRVKREPHSSPAFFRSPYRGQGKTRGHYLRVAAAINLKRAIAWEAGQKPKRERVVKMKKIMGMEQATRKGWARGAKARA